MRAYSLFIFFLVIASCDKPKVLGPKDYVKWVVNPKNDLVEIKEYDKLTYRLSYLPQELIALRKCNKLSVDSCYYDYLKDLQGINHFKLEIISLDKQDPLRMNLSSKDEFYQRMEYFNSWLSNDIDCISGTDTLAFSFLHTERHYGISDKLTILMAFDENDSREGLTMIYDDKVFGAGRMKFHFSEQEINSIPQVKI